MTEIAKVSNNVILTSGDAIAVLWHWELAERFVERHDRYLHSLREDRPWLKLTVLGQNRETLKIEERTYEQVGYSGCSVETISKTNTDIVRLGFHDLKYHRVDCYWRAGNTKPPGSSIDRVLFRSIEFNPNLVPSYSPVNLISHPTYALVMHRWNQQKQINCVIAWQFSPNGENS